MNPVRDASAGDGSGTVSPALVREQVARILKSPSFVQVPTLGRLLQYLVDRTVEGETGRLKEYAVGVEVFGRGSSFDPRTDTIVRAHARRLRKRLEQYYAGDGRTDTILVELPKGHYSVHCRPLLPHQASVAAEGYPSIVVLPFANLSGDSEDEYFADGLTDEIISALAAIPDLRVVARTSAFQFKGRGEDIRNIGRTLGVQLALEGSVRRDGGSIRVAVQLIDARDGFQRWSQTFERHLTSIFTVQDEISGAIVDTLRSRFDTSSPTVRPVVPVSAEAHDCYLKARYFWNRATPEDVAKAIKYFEQAIALDPGYAAAHAGLADAFVFMATVESEAPGPLIDAARKSARAALDLHDLAEAHSAMGAVLGMGDWDWMGAEREFRIALDLMPSFAHARGAYAMGSLAPLGRYDEAIDQLRLAIGFDPLSVFLRTMLAQILILAGRVREAVDELRHALELDGVYAPATLSLAWAYIGQANFAAALDLLEHVPVSTRTFPNFSGHLGYAHARLGQRQQAEDVLRALLERFPGPWVPGVDVGAVYNGLGDTGMALHWLERAHDLHSFDVTFVFDDPRFANLRSDPRLARLGKRAPERAGD